MFSLLVLFYSRRRRHRILLQHNLVFTVIKVNARERVHCTTFLSLASGSGEHGGSDLGPCRKVAVPSHLDFAGDAGLPAPGDPQPVANPEVGTVAHAFGSEMGEVAFGLSDLVEGSFVETADNLLLRRVAVAYKTFVKRRTAFDCLT